MSILFMTVAASMLASGAEAQDPAPSPNQPSPSSTAPAASPIPAPAEGKGEVVFFRRGTIVGSAISCAVHENGAKLTSLPPGRYAALQFDPGPRDFSVQSEATSTVNVNVVAGQIAYAERTVGVGVMAGRPHLRSVTADDFNGRATKLKPVVAKAGASPMPETR